MHASGGRSGDRAHSTPPCLRNCPASGPVGTITQMQRAGVHGRHALSATQAELARVLSFCRARWRSTWQASSGQARGCVWLIHFQPALCVAGPLSHVLTPQPLCTKEKDRVNCPFFFKMGACRCDALASAPGPPPRRPRSGALSGRRRTLWRRLPRCTASAQLTLSLHAHVQARRPVLSHPQQADD